jgi:hypothetical protein
MELTDISYDDANFLRTVSSSGPLGSSDSVRGSLILWPQSAMKYILVAVVMSIPVDACM